MSELKCTCGGTFQPLGREFIRTGEVSQSLWMGRDINDWSEEAIPGELFACVQCRCLRFCADEEWIAQRIAQRQEKQEAMRRAAEREELMKEKRIQDAMKEMALYGEKKLQKIADGETWSKYSDWEIEAARRLLDKAKEKARTERWKDWN